MASRILGRLTFSPATLERPSPTMCHGGAPKGFGIAHRVPVEATRLHGKWRSAFRTHGRRLQGMALACGPAALDAWAMANLDERVVRGAVDWIGHRHLWHKLEKEVLPTPRPLRIAGESKAW